mgnify:CR=1 FL=1
MILKRTGVIVFLLALAAAAIGLFFSWTATPDGVHPKGDGGLSTTAMIALATSLVSFGGSLVGLGMKYLDFRMKALDLKAKELEAAAK